MGVNDQSQLHESAQKVKLPEELTDKKLTVAVHGDTMAGELNKQNPASAEHDQGVDQDRARLAQHIHTYLLDSIKFADQKAGFLFAVATALLAILYHRGIVGTFHTPLAKWTAAEFFGIVGALVAGLAGLAAIAVVTPRLGGDRNGLIYWGSIERFAGPTEYRSALEELDARALTGEVFNHCYELSTIARTKYQLLKWATWLIVIALFPIAVFLVLS